MDRRPVGLALILFVLLTSAVLPNLRAKAITGEAVSAPVPGPPAVGDCVLGPIDPAWENAAIRPGTRRTSVSSYDYPSLSIAGCRGGRFGEVVSVIEDPVRPVVTSINQGSTNQVSVTDDNLDSCQGAATDYVGAAPRAPVAAAVPAYWWPTVIVESTASAPSFRQRAAGQHWLACIVYLQDGGPDVRTLADAERVGASLRDALTTGVARDRLGFCLDAADLGAGGEGGACARRHTGELFGSATTETPTTIAELRRRCRATVEQRTGLPDVTANGSLAVKVRVTTGDGTELGTAAVPAGSVISCALVSVGGRPLTGSLLAWGDRPLPWA